MAATTTAAKKTKPRQIPARPTSNGESNGRSNGHVDPEVVTPDEVTPDEVIAEVPEKKPAEFVFTPEGDDEPITVPLVTVPYVKQRWFWLQLSELEGLAQQKFWLKFAEVPFPVIERIFLLNDAEFIKFFNDWIEASNGASPGE